MDILKEAVVITANEERHENNSQSNEKETTDNAKKCHRIYDIK